MSGSDSSDTFTENRHSTSCPLFGKVSLTPGLVWGLSGLLLFRSCYHTRLELNLCFSFPSSPPPPITPSTSGWSLGPSESWHPEARPLDETVSTCLEAPLLKSTRVSECVARPYPPWLRPLGPGHKFRAPNHTWAWRLHLQLAFEKGGQVLCTTFPKCSPDCVTAGPQGPAHSSL